MKWVPAFWFGLTWSAPRFDLLPHARGFARFFFFHVILYNDFNLLFTWLQPPNEERKKCLRKLSQWRALLAAAQRLTLNTAFPIPTLHF